MSDYYHVRISTKSNIYHDEVRLDLSQDELAERFLQPYQEGRSITMNGRVIALDDITRIKISHSAVPSEELRNLVKVDQMQRPSSLPEDWLIVEKGQDVTYEFIKEPPGKQVTASQAVATTENSRTVFVVHGRNNDARESLFEFLRSIGLKPLEWSQVVLATGKTTPYIGEILDRAFALAGAVVVLTTPDDEARLQVPYRIESDPNYEIELTPQARPNVLFEAGMSMGRSAERTILVELGRSRPFSDIGGRHVVRLDNTTARRQDLAHRLELAGCPVDLSGTDWHTTGNFD
jgi:predicted nucleotide-binding protein